VSLADELAEWQDVDVAQYTVGRAIGLFAGQDFRQVKYVFWTENPLGTGLWEMLGAMVKAGILECRDEPDMQYRWSPAGPDDGQVKQPS
jgi:hypothetical protein